VGMDALGRDRTAVAPARFRVSPARYAHARDASSARGSQPKEACMRIADRSAETGTETGTARRGRCQPTPTCASSPLRSEAT
jgi:hypothetical protein